VSSEPLGPVTIGAREIYDELRSVSGKVDQLGSKVDQVASAHEDMRADLTDHEARIRVLERGRWPLPSLAALIALASLILTLASFTRGG
jgi:TolA-binding protein